MYNYIDNYLKKINSYELMAFKNKDSENYFLLEIQELENLINKNIKATNFYWNDYFPFLLKKDINILDNGFNFFLKNNSISLNQKDKLNKSLFYYIFEENQNKIKNLLLNKNKNFLFNIETDFFNNIYNIIKNEKINLLDKSNQGQTTAYLMVDYYLKNYINDDKLFNLLCFFDELFNIKDIRFNNNDLIDLFYENQNYQSRIKSLNFILDKIPLNNNKFRHYNYGILVNKFTNNSFLLNYISETNCDIFTNIIYNNTNYNTGTFLLEEWLKYENVFYFENFNFFINYFIDNENKIPKSWLNIDYINKLNQLTPLISKQNSINLINKSLDNLNKLTIILEKQLLTNNLNLLPNKNNIKNIKI